MTAEAIRGVAVLSIPLVGEGPYLVPVVVVVALLASSMEAFFGPAQQAMVPRLVDPQDLDAANSLNNLTLSTSRLFYIIGGVVVGVGGSFVAFYINSATFIVAAILLLVIPSHAGQPESESTLDELVSRPSLFGEAREGIQFIRDSPALLAVIAMGVFVDFAFVPLVVVLPVFATVVLGGDGATYGFLLGAFFAGTLLGNLLVGPVRGFIDTHRGPVMVSATILTGVSIGLAAVVPTLVAYPVVGALAGFALAGAANPFLNVPLTTYTQSVVPDEKRGKVFSVLGMAAIVTVAGVSGLITPLIRIGSIQSPTREPM